MMRSRTLTDSRGGDPSCSDHPAAQLEIMRSETFPFAERFAHDVSPLGPVAYFTAGESADLPDVVLLHALGMNYTEWEVLAPLLAKHTRVVGLDMLGCGHSAQPSRPYGLHEITQATWALLRKLNLRQPVLMGHSFGGRVALELALREPRHFSGLMLLNSAGFIRYPALYEKLGRLLLKPRLVGTLLLGAGPLLARRIFASETPNSERFLSQVLGRWESAYAYRFAQHACPMLSDLVSDVLDRLSELNLPISVLWGDEDVLLPYREVEPALRRLRDVQIDVLPRCGHMPNLERPEAVYEATLRLLRRAVAGHAAR
ncbi:MAG TPA: alpha/beta hydrolase [Pseudomonadota bacterium]|nr:alpha/beta hydrolase [Pseudomonadota bacterium]